MWFGDDSSHTAWTCAHDWPRVTEFVSQSQSSNQVLIRAIFMQHWLRFRHSKDLDATRIKVRKDARILQDESYVWSIGDVQAAMHDGRRSIGCLALQRCTPPNQNYPNFHQFSVYSPNSRQFSVYLCIIFLNILGFSLYLPIIFLWTFWARTGAALDSRGLAQNLWLPSWWVQSHTEMQQNKTSWQLDAMLVQYISMI